MALSAILRQSGGSVILAIPKTIASSLAVEAGSTVDLVVQGHTLCVTPARRSLAERLAASPKTPRTWPRDEGWLSDAPTGREAL